MVAPKITLDTNCIINLFDQSHKTPTSLEFLRDLIRLALKHEVDLAITSRVEVDLARDPNEDRRQSLLNALELLPIIPTIGTVLRWDVSRWDNGDVFASTDSLKLEEEVRRLVFPGLTQADPRFSNKISDVDHLCGHATNGRDIFVTDDKGILKRTDGLAAIGIKVCNPTECIDYLDRLETSRRTQQLVAVKSDPRYASIRLAGSASFDYSNNNGMFTIGEGIFLFETKWSKASTGSIHAYSGTQSVAAIALDKTTKQIADLRNVGSLDYSSRSRTARAGQIVVLKNRNNFYAALKVNHVHDDRYQREDELNFDYKIFSEGAP